jgi:hypothetical protein
MRSPKLLMPLALLIGVLLFGEAEAKNVYVIKDQYGVPYTRAYVQEQRAQNMKRAQQSKTADRDVYINLPQNVSGYNNWEISFVDGGGSAVYTFYTNNSTDSYTPLGSVAEGTYAIHFTCQNYYSQGWDLQYYWWTTDDNYYYDSHSVTTRQGNAYGSSVILYGAVVNDNYYSPYIQIDGGY